MSKPKVLTKQEKTKDSYLRRTYHITLAEYNVVLKHQNGRCAICKKRPIDFPAAQAFAVDHCHTTGLLRGLLCWGCNKLIAVAKDDASKLLAASEYLLTPPMYVVFKGNRYTAPGKVGTKKRQKALLKIKSAEKILDALEGKN